MKLVTYHHANRPALGLVRDNVIVDLSAVAPDMLTLIERGPAALTRVREIAALASDTTPLDGAPADDPGWTSWINRPLVPSVVGIGLVVLLGWGLYHAGRRVDALPRNEQRP